MQARCQISTGRGQIQTLPYRQDSRIPTVSLRFPTDSRTLSHFLSAQAAAPPLFGLERAFSGVPENLPMFHPEAARRDQ